MPCDIKVKSQCHDVHIAGTLAVTRTACLFHPFGAAITASSAAATGRAAIIMRMDAQRYGVATRDMPAEPVRLVGVDVGGGPSRPWPAKLRMALGSGCGLPNGGHGVANLHREIQLRAGETLRAVFKYPFRIALPQGVLTHLGGAANRDGR